jgi:chromosome segregation ATPase
VITSSELATAVALVLAGAVALGWILHWLWARLAGAPRTERERLDDLAERLHRAEAAREAAEEAHRAAEARLAAREAELASEMETARAELEGRLEAREAELARALREAEAEARTAWEGLSVARRQIRELEGEAAARRGPV